MEGLMVMPPTEKKAQEEEEAVDLKKLSAALDEKIPHDLRGRTFAQALAESYFLQAATPSTARMQRIGQLWEAVVDRLSV
jgi:hypothetical protein